MTELPTPRPTPRGDGGELPAPDEFDAVLAGRLPGHLGMRVTEVGPGRMSGELDVVENVMAPNGYLHAATVVALADTLCGLGCRLALPDGAVGFTTLELKTSYLSTARSGTIRSDAVLVHGGRRTQIWDATVFAPDGKTMALFRCTQMILYPEKVA